MSVVRYTVGNDGTDFSSEQDAALQYARGMRIASRAVGYPLDNQVTKTPEETLKGTMPGVKLIRVTFEEVEQ